MRATRFTVNLEAEQVEILNRIAKQTGMSASALVRHAIASGLRDPRLFMPPVPTDNMHGGYQQNAEATS